SRARPRLRRLPARGRGRRVLRAPGLGRRRRDPPGALWGCAGGGPGRDGSGGDSSQVASSSLVTERSNPSAAARMQAYDSVAGGSANEKVTPPELIAGGFRFEPIQHPNPVTRTGRRRRVGTVGLGLFVSPAASGVSKCLREP